MKYFLSILIVVVIAGCPKPEDDPDNLIVQDTIPVSMAQEHINWPSLADSPWPMYSHDPQGTKRSQLEGPSIGEIEWSRWTDGVKRQYGFTSFSIGPDSTIYYGSSYEHPPNSSQTWVFYAIDVNGETKWTFRDTLDYNVEMNTAPIITSTNEVIFATPSYGSYVNLYKLDFQGELVWKYRYEGAGRIPDNLNIGLDGTIYFIDSYQNLVAVNSDGALEWVKLKDGNFKADEVWALAISPDGNILYVPGATGYSELYAISLDGQILWEFDLADSLAHTNAQPMVDNQGNSYISVSSGSPSTEEFQGIYSLDSDGGLRWRFPQNTNIDAYTIGKEGHIYFCDQDELIALGYNGVELWRQTLPSHQYSPILIDANSTLYLPGNFFSAINANDGSILWTLELPTTGWQGAAIGYDNFLVYGYADYDSVKYVIGLR